MDNKDTKQHADALRLSDQLGRLAEIYARVCEEADPMRQAVRLANAWGRAVDALEDEALSSGAIRGEVCVMMRFERGDFCTNMKPFLK